MKAIYNDDPEAIEKLQIKIAYLERLHKDMKEVNANYKKYGMEWALKNVSADILRCYHRDMGYSWNKNRIYPGYMLTNNNATINQAKKRLATLMKKEDC